MSSNGEGYTQLRKNRLLATAASAVVVAGLSLGLSAAPALASGGPVIAYNVTNLGYGAGYALFRDGGTHYRYATEAVAVPGGTTIPNGAIGSVELYDQANMDAALIQLRCTGSTCGVWAGYQGGRMAYDNDIIGSFIPGNFLPGTFSAGNNLLLKVYYNPATHMIVFGAQNLTTGLNFTNFSVPAPHPELFTEAGYGGQFPTNVTQAQENFYSSTGPAMPITVVSGIGGTGGLVRDDIGNLSGVTLTPDSSLNSSSGGNFTLTP